MEIGLKRRKKLVAWVAALVLSAIVFVVFLRIRFDDTHPLLLEGAVVRKDADPHKELPLEGAKITAKVGQTVISTTSDQSGYFRLAIPGKAGWTQKPTLSIVHGGYVPLLLPISRPAQLYVAKMEEERPAVTEPNQQITEISAIRARYTVDTVTNVNIGSVVKTFQVVNQGNVPCTRQMMCSPDKKWKASEASLTLEAGPDNHYRHARASCIAGPCPFTLTELKIDDAAADKITVKALNWSDTTTMLVEAEVFHSMVGQNITRSYPVIFGRTLNFTLPASVEGISIEATVDETPIVFPLGPDLQLSWAVCTERTDTEKTQVYRCELKPGYEFRKESPLQKTAPDSAP